MEEALEADAAEGDDEEAGRLRGVLSALAQGVPAPGKREDSERQRYGMNPACMRPLPFLRSAAAALAGGCVLKAVILTSGSRHTPTRLHL